MFAVSRAYLGKLDVMDGQEEVVTVVFLVQMVPRDQLESPVMQAPQEQLDSRVHLGNRVQLETMAHPGCLGHLVLQEQMEREVTQEVKALVVHR